MCCFCDDGPVDGDKYPQGNMFKTGLMDAPCADPTCCCLACICNPCTQWELRRKILNYDMTKYSCCQGYLNCGCFRAGECCEQSCPECCLCCEVVLCPSCAISATRFYVMDWKGLQSDPCDRRLIRCNNCLQLLTCICDILSIFIGDLRPIAQLLRCVSDITYCTISACMAAQVNFEIADGSMASPVPVKQVMIDGPGVVATTTTVVQPGQPVYVQPSQPMYAQQPVQPMYAQQPGYVPQGQPMYAPQGQPMGQPMYTGQPMQQQPMYVQGQPMYQGQPQAYGQPVYVQQPPPQYMQ